MLTALALFTLLAAVCSIIFNKLKLPPLIGYIIAGIILVNLLFSHQDVEAVEAEEEIISLLKHMGLVMLMFCIGLEINIKKIRKQGSFAILVAAVQLPLMVLGGFIAGSFMGYDMTQSIVLGAIISGSSTAVVMAVLKSQGKLDKEHIEMLVLITIMEDIGQVIILSMITPLMVNYGGGANGMDINQIIVLIIKILSFMIISIVVGLRIIPRIINWISDNVSDEILTITSVGLAFGMALLASASGLSSAVGAFLMGMMVASSRKAKSINEKIEPMRDLFMAIFFISIGTEVFPASMLVDNISTVILFFLLFAVLKTATVFLAYWVGNESCRNGFISATSLCAMGEFAFIIAAEALSRNVIDNEFYTSVIGAALISMIMLPLFGKVTDKVWDKAVEKCPRKFYTACCDLCEARSNMYVRVSATSKKSQKAIYKSMTHAYINLAAIAAIEILFYVILEPLSGWLLESFGGSMTLWVIFTLTLNFIMLTVPTYYLINNVKFLDEIIIVGAKRIANMEGNRTNPSEKYERFLSFLQINTFLVIALIDFVIILLVPNSVPMPFWYYLVVLGMGFVTIVVMLKRKKKSEDDDSVPAESKADRSRPRIDELGGGSSPPGRSSETERSPHVLRSVQHIQDIQSPDDAVLDNHISLTQDGLHIEAVSGIDDIGDDVLRKERPQVGSLAVEDDDVRILPRLDRTQGIPHAYGLSAVDRGEVQKILGRSHGGIPSAGFLKEAEQPHLREHIKGVVGSAPIRSDGDVDPVFLEFRNRCDASCGQLHIGCRTAGHGHPRLAHEPDLPESEPCGMRRDAARADCSYTRQPFRRAHPRLPLVLVDLATGLRKVEIHGSVLLVGKSLRAYARLLAAHVYALQSNARHYLARSAEGIDEPPAVVQGAAFLSGLVVIENAPAQHSADPRVRGRLGYDVLGIVQVHERGGTSAHHLHAPETGADIEVLVRAVRIDPERLLQEIRELEIVDHALHDRHRDMRMGVDHAGHDDIARGIDLPVRRTVVDGTNGYYAVAIDHYVPLQDAAFGVLGHYPGIADRRNHGRCIRTLM